MRSKLLFIAIVLLAVIGSAGYFLVDMSRFAEGEMEDAAKRMQVNDSIASPVEEKFLPRIFFDSTVVNDKVSYSVKLATVFSENDGILSVNGKVIDTVDARGVNDLTFVDFNHDGNMDIQISYFTVHFQADLYLYDLRSHDFKLVEGFESYSDATQLSGNPQYYYSYCSVGCADSKWVSYLFGIVNFNVVPYGRIEGNGCDESELKIYIYKIIDGDEENEKLVETLPYTRYIFANNDKADFMERYWNKNFQKFK